MASMFHPIIDQKSSAHNSSEVDPVMQVRSDFVEERSCAKAPGV